MNTKEDIAIPALGFIILVALAAMGLVSMLVICFGMGSLWGWEVGVKVLLVLGGVIGAGKLLMSLTNHIPYLDEIPENQRSAEEEEPEKRKRRTVFKKN